MNIHNDTARLITLNHPGRPPLNLLPGDNEVDDGHWSDLMDKHGDSGDGKACAPGVVRRLIDAGCLSVSSDSKASTSTPSAPTTGVPGSARDAIATVRLTQDTDKLDRWKETETRKTVLASIEEQIEDLMAGYEDDDDEE